MTTDRELMACPFCGGDRIDLVTTYPHAMTLAVAYECNACGIRTSWYGSDVHARKIWNTRQPAGCGEAVAWMVLEESTKYKATFNYELHAKNTARNMAEDGYEPTLHPLYTHPPASEINDAYTRGRADGWDAHAAKTPASDEVVSADRQMLLDIHQEFQMCTHECERCGESDPLSTFDVAILLKEYLSKRGEGVQS